MAKRVSLDVPTTMPPPAKVPPKVRASDAEERARAKKLYDALEFLGPNPQGWFVGRVRELAGLGSVVEVLAAVQYMRRKGVRIAMLLVPPAARMDSETHIRLDSHHPESWK